MNPSFKDTHKSLHITPTSLSIDKLIQRIKTNQIETTELSQWNNYQKSLLIESLIFNLPVPTMFLNITHHDHWKMITGYDILIAIKEFVIDQTLVLSELTYCTDLNGFNFNDLPKNVQCRILERELNFNQYIQLNGDAGKAFLERIISIQ